MTRITLDIPPELADLDEVTVLTRLRVWSFPELWPLRLRSVEYGYANNGRPVAWLRDGEGRCWMGHAATYTEAVAIALDEAERSEDYEPVAGPCGCCGRSYDAAGWTRLKQLGSVDYEGIRIDQADCVCGNTLGRESPINPLTDHEREPNRNDAEANPCPS